MQDSVFNILLKLLLVVLLSWVIYDQVFAKENIDDLYQAFIARWTWDMAPWAIAALLLMPVNWLFETLKWHRLIRDFDKNSLWRHYTAILAGVSFSIFTPNRIGEYGGRILMVEPENNWTAVVATLVGSLSQLLVLLTMGIFGFIFYVYWMLDLELYLFGGMIFLCFSLAVVLLLLFYNVDLIIPFIKRASHVFGLEKWSNHFEILRNFDRKILNGVLAYAFLRYVVYAFQYFLLLKFFGVEVPFFLGMAGIATIFLLQTSIPLPPLMGLLVRGEIALYIWGSFCTYELNILAATFSLWVINLIIPALIGMVFIVNTNVIKSLGYGKKDD